jgi:hypothetical protein
MVRIFGKLLGKGWKGAPIIEPGRRDNILPVFLQYLALLWPFLVIVFRLKLIKPQAKGWRKGFFLGKKRVNLILTCRSQQKHHNTGWGST